MTFSDAKNRFSNRVADYLRYRPHYPEDVLDFLRSQCHLSAAHTVADIGSGTGFLSELFLKNGNPVFGVEPNQEMRQAGEVYLAGYPRFTSIDGSAEATTLHDSCADFIAVGQAFHWFKPAPTHREFARILRRDGWVAIVWNDRTLSTTGFAVSYEELLVRFGTDYSRVRDSYPRTEDIRAFFGHEKFLTEQLPNFQDYDLESLRGRLRSSSYVPTEADSNFAPMMAELDALFATHQKNGRVPMEFSTWVHVGQLNPGSSQS